MLRQVQRLLIHLMFLETGTSPTLEGGFEHTSLRQRLGATYSTSLAMTFVS